MCRCESNIAAAGGTIAGRVLGHFSSSSNTSAIYNSAMSSKLLVFWMHFCHYLYKRFILMEDISSFILLRKIGDWRLSTTLLSSLLTSDWKGAKKCYKIWSWILASWGGGGLQTMEIKINLTGLYCISLLILVNKHFTYCLWDGIVTQLESNVLHVSINLWASSSQHSSHSVSNFQAFLGILLVRCLHSLLGWQNCCPQSSSPYFSMWRYQNILHQEHEH